MTAHLMCWLGAAERVSCMHLLLLIWHFAAHMTYVTLVQRKKRTENILYQNRKLLVPLNSLLLGEQS